MVKYKWKAVNLADVQQQITAGGFIHKSACGCQIAIHTFVEPGDQLEGRVRPCPNHDRADRAGAFHLYMPTQKGEVGVAIRLTGMLRQAIFDNHLWGQYIRITYKGSVPTRFGHAKKIYLVEVQKGCIFDDFETVTVKNKKNRKPRQSKPTKRPLAAAAK